MTDQAFEVREKLAKLEGMLLKATPEMPVLLREIHRNLKQDPDVVTLLSDPEKHILVAALKKQTNTDIATKAVKKNPKKAMSKMTVEDL